MDRLAVDLSLRDERLGAIKADLTLDAAAPIRRASGTAHVERLNVRALTRDGNPRLASTITGDTRFDLVLPEEGRPIHGSWAVDVDRVRIAGYEARRVVGNGRIDGTTVRLNIRGNAYGGHATAAGTVRAAAPLVLDLRGRATGVDLRNLPAVANVPPATSDLQFAYTLKGRGSAFSGEVALDRSTLAGATIEQGATGTFSFGNGAPTYTAKGQIAGLDVQRVGREFGIQAIAVDRYRSVVNGPFDVSGSGGGRYPLTLDVTGTLVDSHLFDATFPRMDVTTNLAGGHMRVRTAGMFTGLNPALVTGDTRAEGMLNGSIDAETAIRDYASGVTVDSLDTSGHVELTRSTFGKLTIDSAVVDGSYAAREGQLKQLQITGPDLNVTGEGTIALNRIGRVQSDGPRRHAVARPCWRNRRPGDEGVGGRRCHRHRQCARAQSERLVDRQQYRTRQQRGVEPEEHLHGDGSRSSNRAGAAAGQQHGDIPRDRRPEDQRGHSRHDLFEIAPRVQRCRQEGPRELTAGGRCCCIRPPGGPRRQPGAALRADRVAHAARRGSDRALWQQSRRGEEPGW